MCMSSNPAASRRVNTVQSFRRERLPRTPRNPSCFDCSCLNSHGEDGKLSVFSFYRSHDADTARNPNLTRPPGSAPGRSPSRPTYPFMSAPMTSHSRRTLPHRALPASLALEHQARVPMANLQRARTARLSASKPASTRRKRANTIYRQSSRHQRLPCSAQTPLAMQRVPPSLSSHIFRLRTQQVLSQTTQTITHTAHTPTLIRIFDIAIRSRRQPGSPTPWMRTMKTF